jgi:thioredoxin reductase
MDYVDHIILGAGPAGLQMAYFLQRAGASYVVLEKNSNVASFFRKYPRQRRLISVNKIHHKPYTHETRFKYDWNSLLVHEADEDIEVKFHEFSQEYYPHVDALIAYLEQFTKSFELHKNIIHGVEVTEMGGR